MVESLSVKVEVACRGPFVTPKNDRAASRLGPPDWPKRVKVFYFFFSKKKYFLSSLVCQS
jgi:hypothetical protein